ncbi:MAG: NAD(P)/FAD-dependent oxidoreductase [Promethearchaeota archaeon]
MPYDLIIVGGGPGGATSAKIVAEQGLNVLLLEAGEEGRYKCCAGGIPMRCEDFSPIPHGVNERVITGGVLVTPKKEPMEFEATGEKNKGFCMFRTDFDKYLLNQARDAGVEVKYKFRVKNVHIKEDKVKVIGPNEYDCKCIVIATGIGGAILQRSLGIEVPPMINAVQAEFAIPETIIDEQFGNKIWEFFNTSLIDHGIAWAFPKLNAVSIGVLGKGVKKTHFDAFLQSPQMKQKLVNGDMMTFSGRKIWAAPIPDKMIKKPYGNRVMVIGDACGTADPILYEGIYQARMSAKIAAEVFCKAFEEGDFGEKSLSRYKKHLLKELYNEELRYSYRFHRLLFHSNQLENLIEATYSLAQEDPDMLESTIALFSGTQTRKQIWERLMSNKWKLIKNLGISNSLRLIPSLLRALRI